MLDDIRILPAPHPHIRNFAVDVLWCPNGRKGGGNGWSFPPTVEKLLKKWTIEQGDTVLHPFGGRSRFGLRMDIDPIVRPDVVADAWLPPFGRDSFDTVILDPPYDHINAQMKVALFRQYVWIARKRIIWFHTQWAATYGGVQTERCWLVRVGDGCHVRCLQFFTPRYPKQPPYKYILRGPGIKYNRWHGGAQLGLGIGSIRPPEADSPAPSPEAYEPPVPDPQAAGPLLPACGTAGCESESSEEG